VRTLEIVRPKNPLCGNQQGKRTSETSANIGSRKHGVFAPPIPFPPGLLLQRAGLKGHFANSEPYVAIRSPPVNTFQPLLFQ
jgi:hypothetical protein